MSDSLDINKLRILLPIEKGPWWAVEQPNGTYSTFIRPTHVIL